MFRAMVLKRVLGGNGSFGSDLDLLVAGEGEESVQKAVKFLTEERASGALFKVDFRLRPYAEGALAVPVKRYGEYYGKEAQGWEVQTLCRARAIAGAKEPMQEFWPGVEKRWNLNQFQLFYSFYLNFLSIILSKEVPSKILKLRYDFLSLFVIIHTQCSVNMAE